MRLLPSSSHSADDAEHPADDSAGRPADAPPAAAPAETSGVHRAPESPAEARAAGARDTDLSRTGTDAGGARPAPGPDAGPSGPAKLGRKGILEALKRTFKQFSEDNVTDWAAALTYYGVLSIFPGVLVLVSVLGMLSDNGQKVVQDTVQEIAPREIQTLLDQVLSQVSDPGTAGLAAIVGIVVAFWSASGYTGAFMRASNSIYDVPEGRPVWKTLPIRLAVTAVIGLMLIASVFILVFTGKVAEATGRRIGLGDAALDTWSIAKWPVLILIVSLMFAILYWASPNAKTGGFRWVSPGGIFAVVLWIAASGAFTVYLANFDSYDKTYGTVAGLIAFLVWLWISNIAILLGAELDAELERGRAIAAGHPADGEPFLQLRDDRKLKKGSEKGLSAT
ncbi:YihY/virulence factor BrkB family protein [Actinoplanes sp. NPDC049668]|uniref:YihY/virulence factor BrkB family protein n=1 Tax=unclassified Actinoplanes TaxID=2626549 RepID=UPI0033B42DF2